MYMNCAVVDIVPSGSGNNDQHTTSRKIDARDASQANAAAQAALSSYPQLFVANLKRINDCVTRETVYVIFDSPGANVAFAGVESASVNPSFKKGECVGKGIKKSPSSSASSSAPPSSPQGPSPGDDGQWHGQGKSDDQQAMSGSSAPAPAPAQQAAPPAAEDQGNNQGSIDVTTGQKPSAEVENEVDAYLDNLYGGKTPTEKREAVPTTDHVSSSTSDQRQTMVLGGDVVLLKGHNDSFKHHADYNDMHASVCIAKRTTCKTVTIDVKQCQKPNRWVKTNTCAWSCKRKGRAAKRPATAPSRIAKKLAALERQMATLMKLTKKKGTKAKGVAVRRQDITAEQSNNTGFTVDITTDVADPTLALFLVYLERLQDKVIECIRYVAATTPDDDPAVSIESALSDMSIPPIGDEEFFKRSSNPQDLEVQVDEEYLSTSHEAASKKTRQLVVPSTTEEDLPTFAFYSYASALSDTIATALEFWLDGIGPLFHDTATQLLSYDSPTWFNGSNIGTANLTGYPTTEITNALNSWLETLDIIVGQIIKQSMEAPQPQPEGRPAFYPIDSEGRPAYPYLNTTAKAVNGTLNSTTPDQQAYDKAIADAEQLDAADAFPYLMGPGPVVSPDVHVKWPGPNHPGEGNLEEIPAIVDDLGPVSEEEVRKWFEELDEKEDLGLGGGEMAGVGGQGGEN